MSAPDDTTRSAGRSAARAALIGARRCVGIPALGLFLSMVGFGALARDLGFSGLQAFVTTALVWGLPGQIAFVELAAAGAPLMVMVAAVAFANMRMLPMTVTGLPLILGGRRAGFMARLFYVQFMAVTAWTQMNADAGAHPPDRRLPFYLGFVAVLYAAGLAGTLAGHAMGGVLPEPAMRIAIFMTPLYLLLLVAAARSPTNRLAVALGAAVGVGLFPLIGDASVLAAGLIGGSLAIMAGRRLGRSPNGAADG